MVEVNIEHFTTRVYLQCKCESSVHSGFTVSKGNRNGWTSQSTNDDRPDWNSSATEVNKSCMPPSPLATREIAKNLYLYIRLEEVFVSKGQKSDC